MRSQAEPAAMQGRLLSLDVLRGLTIAGMILVTDPGTYAAVYPQLRHAVWNDPTATDLIFPCFLLITGISMTVSFAARLRQGATRSALLHHALRRSAWLVGLGLVVNGFPDYDLRHLRLPGILQRIGLCYALVSVLYLWLSRPGTLRRPRMAALGGTALAVLVGYWLLLTYCPAPGFGAGRLDPVGALPAVVDRLVLTVPHMWLWGVRTPPYGITFDPEGLLSTLGALVTVLVGVLAGEMLQTGQDRKRPCVALSAMGLLLWLAALALRPWMPINKQIYTPTFALWSTGLSLLAFAALLWLVDLVRVRRGWGLALIFGTNAIFAFVLSQFVTAMLGLLHVGRGAGRVDLHTLVYQRAFTAAWLPPRLGSLGYAMLIVVFDAALVLPLYRRRLFLKL